MRHTGRTALVTGAASGIGRVIATALAHEGAKIAMFDREGIEKLPGGDISRCGGEWMGWQLDVCNHEAVRIAVGAAEAELGPIDLLVNCAGIVDHIAPVLKMKPDAWTREIAVNLGGPFNLIQATAAGMVERRFGRIVNISSMAARGGLYLQAGYSSSKSGLLGLTRNVTLELARFGVTCNAVLPGLITTEKVLAMPEAIRAAGVAATPARRLGKPEEVAALVSFLCSEEAGFINGAEIDISGGGHLNTVALGSRKENSA
jgi:NAD(P)-dependent dehydrogenase (short-subunit alcohol dehydrogenase family)